MKYNNIEFDAIVATPGCGKSYLCDKYPDRFIDVDEVRLRCKYIVPENITRKELEASKGEREFPRKANHINYIKDLYNKLDEYLVENKILIAAPHPEVIDYFVDKGIRFAFVFQDKSMKEEIRRRLTERGNPQSTIDKNVNNFEYFYKMNCRENKSVVHYKFKKDEYLEDIIKKFGYKF